MGQMYCYPPKVPHRSGPTLPTGTPPSAPASALWGRVKGGVAPTGAALVLLLAGCAPDLGAMPEMAKPDSFATSQSFKAKKNDWPTQTWWTAYDDAGLNSLIDEALQGSPTLKMASARLRAAVAEAGTAEADLWPTLTASGNLSEYQVSSNQLGKDQRAFMPKGWHHEAQIAAGLQYQLDFFGKNRAALAAATSAAEAAQADEAAARLQISTGVATVYAQLVQLFADKRLAEEALHQREESAGLTRKRLASNLENASAVAQAEAQVWAAHGTLDTVNRLITLTQNQLAALMGKGPDRGRSITPDQVKTKLASPGLPENLPLSLVGRRPDIVAARKRAEAAASSIKVANASFYPEVNLVGQFGVQSLDAKYLLTAKSEFGSFGPSVTLPIFDYGRLTNQYGKARADYDAAAASYDATLTDALRDVADAYTNRQSVETEILHARAALKASEEAYRVIKIRYGAGLARYIEVLSTETDLINQRRTVSDLETQAFSYDIALVRALGGGYAVSPNTADGTAVAKKR